MVLLYQELSNYILNPEYQIGDMDESLDVDDVIYYQPHLKEFRSEIIKKVYKSRRINKLEKCIILKSFFYSLFWHCHRPNMQVLIQVIQSRIHNTKVI